MATHALSKKSASRHIAQQSAPRKPFTHPRTGLSLQDVTFFTPEGSDRIHHGRVVRHGGLPPGVLYFLGTGGDDGHWINPADTRTLCAEIKAGVEKDLAQIARFRREILEMQDQVWKMREVEERSEHDLVALDMEVDQAQARCVRMYMCYVSVWVYTALDVHVHVCAV
jgi:hypothetical protein